MKVKVVPWNYEIQNEKDFCGCFISNGPGDPSTLDITINNISKLVENGNLFEIICIYSYYNINR